MEWIGDHAFRLCTELTRVTLSNQMMFLDPFLFQDCEALTEITIPDSVTGIGEGAFFGCKALTEITIPDNVTGIGERAFSGCKSLTRITIPNSVEWIGNDAFQNCISLTGITIPNKVTVLSNNLFSGCTGLTGITIPDSVTMLGDSVFMGCTGLTDITLPNTVIGIGNYVFSGCTSLTEITIPNSVEWIGDYGFQNCTGLADVTLSTKMTYIGQYLFTGCAALSDITIPDSVTGIGNYAFSGCTALTGITIPNSVEWIGDRAFKNCAKLADVVLSTQMTSIAQYLFQGCTALTGITIPDSVTGIGNYAFLGCASLTGITIPNSVEWIGDGAFKNCAKLADVALSTQMTYIAQYLFQGCEALTEIAIPDAVTGIGNNAFQNCVSLTEISFGDNVTSIGPYAFSGCASLAGITIPNSVEQIGDYAFQNCTGLAGITLSNRMTYIGQYLFTGCTALTDITIPDSVTGIGNDAFSGCTALTGITIPNSVEWIGDRAFKNCAKLADVVLSTQMTSIAQYLFQGCTALTDITIPDSITGIGSAAFYDCNSLTGITIPDSVTGIGNEAFSNCVSLTEILFGDNVTNIGAYAFSGCASLAGITIPNSVEQIGNYAFQNCTGLADVTLSNRMTYIGQYLFQDCKALTGITLPNSVTGIEKYAFSGCTSLVEITIPENVTGIGSYAFRSCTGLQAALIMNAAVNIGSAAFSGCDSLTIWGYTGSTSEQYAEKNNIPFETLGTQRCLQLTVLTPDGADVTQECAVTWYAGSDGRVLGTGAKIYVSSAYGADITYQIVPGGALADVYMQPEPQQAQAEEAVNSIVYRLSPVIAREIAVTVTDADGNRRSDAAVTAELPAADGAVRTVELTPDADGVFRGALPDAPAVLRVSLDRHFTYTKTLPAEGDVQLDVSLKALPDYRIHLSLTRISAAAPGETPFTAQADDFGGLAFTLFNLTADAPITDFEAVFPYIYLPEGAAAPGDTLRIGVSDPAGRYTAQDVTATTDERLSGSAQMTFTENGRILVSDIMGDACRAILFDAHGNTLCAAAVTQEYRSDPLPDGDYQIALLQDSRLLRSVSALSRLNGFGLAEGSDYLLLHAAVRSGEITLLTGGQVPSFDESLFYRTVPEATFCIAAAASVAAGRTVMVCCDYRLDPASGAEAEAVRFAIPPQAEPVISSLYVSDKGHTFSYTDHILTIRLSDPQAKIRFYVVPTTAGALEIPAELAYRLGEDTVTQPLGAAVFTAELSKIEAPGTVAAMEIPVTGTALPHSTVEIYDNERAVGSTQANANGTWSFTVLPETDWSASYHDIYALLANDKYPDAKAQTAHCIVQYNPQAVQLSKITVIHNGQTVAYDYLNPAPVRSLSVNPGALYFTFLVDFKCADPAEVFDVNVTTVSGSGTETVIPCAYSAEKGCWLGTYTYNSTYDIPSSISCQWNNLPGIVFDAENAERMRVEYEAYENAVAAYVENDLEFTDAETTDDYSIQIATDLTTSEVLGIRAEYHPDYRSFDFSDLVFAPAQDGKETAAAADGPVTLVYVRDPQKEELTVYASVLAVDLALEADAAETAGRALRKKPMKASGDPDYDYIIGRVLDLSDVFFKKVLPKRIPSPSDLYSVPKHLIDEFNDLSNYIGMKKEVAFLRDESIARYQTINKLLGAKCKDGSTRLSGAQMKDAALLVNSIYAITNASLNSMDAMLNNFLTQVQWESFRFALAFGAKEAFEPVQKFFDAWDDFRAPFKDLNKSRELIVNVFPDAEPFLKPIDALDTFFESCETLTNQWSVRTAEELWGEVYGIENEMNSLYDELTNLILSSYKSCDSKPPVPKPPHGSDPIYFPHTIDPSGYVYEAVPSNRLKDVTAEIYYYDDAAAQEVLWDAAEYDQYNPLLTDENGVFAWDVPEGKWLVKFRKEGSLDADSRFDPAADKDGWLPVPPPQLEVNTAMISEAAPSVAAVNIYENEIQILFTQYMQPDTVNTDTVRITAGGEPLAGTLEAVNAEFNYDETAQYASVFAFTPASPLQGEVQTEIRGAVNYAGAPMEGTYTASGAPEIKPESIELILSSPVDFGGSGTLDISVLPAGAGANKTITLTSACPQVIRLAEETVTLDENGRAQATVVGELPGGAIITAALDGTQIKAAIDVATGAPAEPPEPAACERVTANLANGAAVPAGTELILSTATEGAQIYYTLDGTCPCVEDSDSRFLYTGPIPITEDIFIIAYAVKDGLADSKTASFMFSVSPAGYLPGDPDNDGAVTAADARLALRRSVLLEDYAEGSPAYIACDVDGNGLITAADARLILRAAVGLETLG